MTPPDADSQVAELRTALELVWFPREADHWRLADLLQARGLIRLQWTDGPRCYAATDRDGRRLIVLAQRAPEPETTAALLEEIGHALTARHQVAAGPNRLHLLNDDRDELLARRWVLAWLLPLSLIEDPETRARRLRKSGATAEQVEERLRVLGRGVADLEAV